MLIQTIYIQNSSYSFISKVKITYDSITAEKSGYEKFSQGRTEVDGKRILDINLVFSGEYAAKLFSDFIRHIYFSKLVI